MTEPTARAVSTAAIWISVAIILAFGLCKMNWGEGFLFIVISALLLGAAVASTAFVWCARPGEQPDGSA